MSAWRGALLALLPFVAIFLGLRACVAGSSARWLAEVQPFDLTLRIALDEKELLAVASDADWARRFGREALAFRRALEEREGDLFPGGRGRRLVVVGFRGVEALRAYAGERVRADPKALGAFHDSTRGAIFLPQDAGMEVLRHEMVHFVLARGAGPGEQLSPWLGEGLAQYFETVAPGDRSGLAPSLRVRLGAIAGAFDPDDLLALQDYGRFVGADGARNYAAALLMTGFLLDRRPREAFLAYLEKERSAEVPARLAAFHALFRREAEPFRRELAAYGAGG
ncbi:MAG: hypothetical protein ACT4PV_06880 [Planctomycetaceae bacterium]